jgi:hypothetical protein
MSGASATRRVPEAADSAAAGALPNVLVIGAMKCGTSALHYYLDLHPEISMSSPKELNFFCGEPELPDEMSSLAESERCLIAASSRNWSRGPRWYASQFDPDAPFRGEASPNYTAPWQPRAAERIASTVPDARLVFMVRDPLRQLISQYLHYRHGGNESRPIAEALADPHGIYLERARYHARLRPYLERFPRERILVLSQERLHGQRREAIAEVYRFLGVEEGFYSPRIERDRHRSESKGRRARLLRRVQHSRLGRAGRWLPQEAKWYLERLASAGRRTEPEARLDDATRARVLDALADDVARLREVTGLRLEEWSI